MLRNYYGLSAYLDKSQEEKQIHHHMQVESEDHAETDDPTCTSSSLLAMYCTHLYLYLQFYTCSPVVHHGQQYPKKAWYDLQPGLGTATTRDSV